MQNNSWIKVFFLQFGPKINGSDGSVFGSGSSTLLIFSYLINYMFSGRSSLPSSRSLPLSYQKLVTLPAMLFPSLWLMSPSQAVEEVMWDNVAEVAEVAEVAGEVCGFVVELDGDEVEVLLGPLKFLRLGPILWW
jgi:hypothetical protein